MTDPYVERDMGAKAARLLDDAAFSEAVARLKEKMMVGWENSKSDETAEREEFFRMTKLLDALTKELQFMVDDGAVASEQIKREESG